MTVCSGRLGVPHPGLDHGAVGGTSPSSVVCITAAGARPTLNTLSANGSAWLVSGPLHAARIRC